MWRPSAGDWQEAQVADDADEDELVRAPTEREEPEEEAHRSAAAAAAEPAVPEAPKPTEPAAGSAIDLSVGANPLSCFPSLAAPTRSRLTVIAHTPTLPKKRPFYPTRPAQRPRPHRLTAATEEAHEPARASERLRADADAARVW